MSLGSAANRVLGWLGPDRTLAERAALFAAAASVGPSFEPGLQPRRTVHQAIATGVISATTLSVVTATQSGIQSLARTVMRRSEDSDTGVGRWVFAIGANLVVGGAAAGVARALPSREDESLRRGALRVIADRSARVAAVGAALSATIGAADLVAEHVSGMGWARRVPLALPAGIAVSAWQIHRVHREAAANGDSTIAQVSTRNSAAIALGVGAGVIGLQFAERAVAHGVSRAITRVAPSYDAVSNPIGHLISLGLLGGALTAGYEYAVRRVEQGGSAIEPAYEMPPNSQFVSGGPGSVVPFSSLSREGRRFINMALTGEEIQAVMGEAPVAEPARIFVGLDSAVEVEDRVDMLMDELDRTGAFDRSILVFASPTGSGYINYVFAEALEYLALGDCAIATMQYSMLPSSMSLTRTGLAIEQNRAIMHAITGYLRGMPPEKRPRFMLFGESLGALTMQDIWRHRTAEAIDRDFVSASIFLGTPSATEFAKAWRLDPERVDPSGQIAEVDSFEEYLELPDRLRIHHLLLSHHDDPIPKFGTNLLLRKPAWLGDDRPVGVPKSSSWRPGTTFVLTGIDLVNAMEVVPGKFGRRGHDYREDIARFVSAIYQLPVAPERMARIEAALRERELQWAQRRVVSEQFARAREAVTRELRNWGVSGADQGLSLALRPA